MHKELDNISSKIVEKQNGLAQKVQNAESQKLSGRQSSNKKYYHYEESYRKLPTRQKNIPYLHPELSQKLDPCSLY